MEKEEKENKVCANWFRNNMNWNEIENSGIATQEGNGPWGIMTSNICNDKTKEGFNKTYVVIDINDPDYTITDSCENNCKKGKCK